jgi:hypothetical protein
MEEQLCHRSDRIPLEIPIQVSGSDVLGKAFTENTRTRVLSRHGAKILLTGAFVAEQELYIRALETGKEIVARVVGLIGKETDGFSYGIEFLDPDVNLWGIEFPPVSESEHAASRLFLECTGCHERELIYLNGVELEVFEANGYVQKACKRCRDVVRWKRPLAQNVSEETSPSVHRNAAPESSLALATEPANRRKHVRVNMNKKACICRPSFGEEIVRVQDVAPGGLSFICSKVYMKGSTVEIAAPYLPGTTNIFVPARIAHYQELQDKGLRKYGAAYLRNLMGTHGG